MTELESGSDGKPRQCRDWSPVDKLREVVKRQDITLLELGPAFQDASKDDIHSLVVRSEGHWNVRGHRLAAEQVHRAAIDSGLLDVGQ